MASNEMKHVVYVGVDSGGTRTNVEIVIRDEGKIVGKESYEVFDSLSGELEPNKVPSVLNRIFAPLAMHLEQLGVSDASIFAWVSAAGFSRWTRDDYILGLDEVTKSFTSYQIEQIGAANDAVTLLLGSESDGVVIAGTGSNVIVRSPDNQLYQAGGHGWVGCDYGSGFWIGLRGIRQAYRDFEAGIDSVLLQRFQQTYGLRPDDERAIVAKLRDLAVSHQNTKKEIAKFTTGICSASERGDKGAQDIVKAEAEDLADVMAGCLRRNFGAELFARGLQLVQGGSVIANDFYRRSFETQLEMRLRSGSERQAEITWSRVETVGEAAVNLAMSSPEKVSQLLTTDLLHRPAIILR